MRKFTFYSLLGILFLTSFKSINNDWIELKPENGNCSIQMPSQPTAQEKIVNSEIGELKTKMFFLQPANGSDENKLYGLSFADYPEGTIHSDSTNLLKDFFDNSRDQAIENVHGKLLSETIIKINGYPGRESRIDFKNGLAIIKHRTYLVKNRIYILQVITLTENSYNVSINRFLDSFKLTP